MAVVGCVVVEFGFKFSEPFHGIGELGSELLVARRNSCEGSAIGVGCRSKERQGFGELIFLVSAGLIFVFVAWLLGMLAGQVAITLASSGGTAIEH